MDGRARCEEVPLSHKSHKHAIPISSDMEILSTGWLHAGGANALNLNAGGRVTENSLCLARGHFESHIKDMEKTFQHLNCQGWHEVRCDSNGSDGSGGE